MRETGEVCEANGVIFFKMGEILSLIERDGGGGEEKGERGKERMKPLLTSAPAPQRSMREVVIKSGPHTDFRQRPDCSFFSI